VASAWLLGDGIRQARMLQTVVSALLTSLGLLLWLAFFSRLPGRTRLLGVGAVFAAVLAFASLFRLRGVSGDLAPVLDFRWSRNEPPPLPKAPPPAPGAATVEAPPPGPTQAAPLAEATTAPRKAEAVPPGPDRDARPSSTSPPEALSWPRFLGGDGSATLPGPHLARDWSARPPKLVWKQPIGQAWSSFAVEDGLAVTQEQRGNDELVVAYALETGRPVWSHADQTRYDTVIAGVGPRATPTIAGGRVFAVGATGILNALDLKTGRLLWSRPFVTENEGNRPEWGRSGSPLVRDGRVIVSAGGKDGRSLVAYDAATGEKVWGGGHDRSAFASPALLTLAGRRQVVIFNQASVAGHDPQTGALLWEHPFPGEQPNVAQPLPLPGDRLLLSAGYGVGSKVIALAAGEGGTLAGTLVWETPRLKSKFANLVLHDGFVYGLDDGVLTCLDPATGERRWKGGRYGHGQLLLVGGLLLVQTEEGELVLIEPSPEGHRELAKASVLEGKTWNPPALVGHRLLARNDREAALYELPRAE
jgi:outer membrane protein assembly factor BamB